MKWHMVCTDLQVILWVGVMPLAWALAGSILGHYGFSQDYEVSSVVLGRDHSGEKSVQWIMFLTILCLVGGEG